MVHVSRLFETPKDKKAADAGERIVALEREVAGLKVQRSFLAAIAAALDDGEILAAEENLAEVKKRWPQVFAWADEDHT